PRAVVLVRRAHAEEAELAELVDHVAREVRGAVPLRRERLDPGAAELARQVDDLALHLGETGGLNRDRHRNRGRSFAPGALPPPFCGAAGPARTCRCRGPAAST